MKIYSMYMKEAESIVPRNSTGWGYFGDEVKRLTAYKGKLSLFIHWGDMRVFGRGWCSMTFSDSSYSKTKPWYIPWGSTFLTRKDAVKALAKSLQLMDASLPAE